ncbi:hypothetical protein D3C75_1285470 [compost metagenome]
MLDEPANAIIELAGPVKLPISEFIYKSLAAANDSREVVIEDRGQYFYTKVEKDSLVPIGENKVRTAPTHLEDWLARK